MALAVFAGVGATPQEPVGKRLSAIVGVAIEEYTKGVDSAGRLISAMEFEEATGFLKEARDVATRLTTPTAAAVRIAIDSMAAAANRRATPTDLRKFYDAFTQALGADGALDLPSRAVDLAAGRTIYATKCAACHGVSGGGGPAVGSGPAPPPIGQMAAMRDVTPALAYRIVSVGIQGTTMKGWSDELSADQRWDVVAYVNTMRATDAERARGRATLARICPRCAAESVRARDFEWQASQSDAVIAAMLRAGDAATGLTPSTPLSGPDADATVAALRADAVVMTRAAQTAAGGAFDPRGAARNVLKMLDDALAAARAGRGTDASDLAFDAYIAFEPLETNARMHDPALVARMEREFADFHSSLKASKIPAAETHRSAIEREMSAVVDLAVATSTKWGTFLEAFLIILREGFEAILVLGAMVTFLVKTGNKKRVRDIWIGGFAGIGASVVLTILLKTLLASVPASREVIEGATMLVAVLVLFSVSYWLLSKVEAARWQQFIREKVTSALSHGGGWTLAFVAFLAVFREGAETALFFQALLARSEGTAIPVAGGLLAGGVTLSVVFTLFYRFGVRIPLRPFFAVTSALLYWMAFVFAGKGIKELQEGGAMTRTPIAGFPHVDIIGIYPTVETLLAQLVLVGLLLFALWRTLRPLPNAGEVSKQRAPLPVVTNPSAPIPPDVAVRLAELQVTAKRLQERVETLEREVEHDPTLHGDRPK
jgi:high-affinity iron transporter